MIAASIGKKQIGKVLLGAVAAVIVIVGGVYFIGKGKDGTVKKTDIPGATTEEREAYLLSVGIQVDTTSSVAEVVVPEEFDERFTAYNELLKTIGFDLEDLKGETVKKCTYTVTNKPELGENISAILLIYEDKVVAGHLVDNATGTLYALYEVTEEPVEEAPAEEEATEEPTTETILPEEEIDLEQEPEAEQETSAAPEEYPTE